MKIVVLRLLLLCIVLLGMSGVSAAQDGISKKQQEKNMARKGKEDKKARVKKEKDDRKRHLSIQDKETRKRIKRNAKRADRGGPGQHRDGFFQRTFSRRR